MIKLQLLITIKIMESLMKKIAILFESHEWSCFKLCDELNAAGFEAKLIDTEGAVDFDFILSCDLVVNRVFASAQFRGHTASFEQTANILSVLQQNNIPVTNSTRAFFYDISKILTTNTLAQNGIAVPKTYGVFKAPNFPNIKYPCVVKPNCGGRSNYTYILQNKQMLNALNLPDIEFIAQQFIEPQYGYLTRIEVIGNDCALILKRSVAKDGLSSYSSGSTYSLYNNCSSQIKSTAVAAMQILGIETGSLDVIENDTGFYIIDVNSTSNVAEENTKMFNFDLMKQTAQYIAQKYL